MPDVYDFMQYEDGQMTEEATLAFFADLIKSGQAWSLQGSYGRTARAFIDAGLISEEGEVL